MSEQSIEEFLFNHKIYKEAQANFLKKGLQGSADDMLMEIAKGLRYYTSDHPDIHEFFMQKIAEDNQDVFDKIQEGLQTKINERPYISFIDPLKGDKK